MHKDTKIRHLKKSMTVTPDILKACAKGDRKVINELYEFCFHLLMPVCFRYHNNEEDARAAYNVGFVKILGSLDKVDYNFNFNAWSRRIMINTLIDEYRREKKYRSRITKSNDERELDYYSTGYDNDAVSNLGYANIMMLVDELPVTTGHVFKLYVIEGYAHKEIGEQLEMSEGTSKWHLSTARKLLREKLEQLENQNKRMVI